MRKNKKRIAVYSIVIGLIVANVLLWQNLKNPHQISADGGGLNYNYGLASYVSSLPSSSEKNTLVAKTTDLGFGWVREEYTYQDSISFVPYDAAYSKINAAGLKILGLLTYPEGRSHDAWKSYVSKVVSRYPGVGAWEIMNEADNYLSAADYTTYLKEASAIIRSKTSAPIVLSGLTARWEVYPFWDGVAAAGGWGDFDKVGLHIYHDGNPYEDSYNNGIFSSEIKQVVVVLIEMAAGNPFG